MQAAPVVQAVQAPQAVQAQTLYARWKLLATIAEVTTKSVI